MYKLNRLIKSSIWFLFGIFIVLGGILYLGRVVDSDMMNMAGLETVLLAFEDNIYETKTNNEEMTSESGVVDDDSLVVSDIIDLNSEQVATIEYADARAKLVANFIERNDYGKDSPLQPYDEYGRIFVKIADEYGLDFRLLPAIARKESTFCKSNIGRKYYNCFGYGVPASGITEAGKFSSYEEGIRVVASSLKKSYLDKGLTDPEAIMTKYCPPSAEGGGTWAAHLNQWLAEMRYDDKAAGVEKKENVDLREGI